MSAGDPPHLVKGYSNPNARPLRGLAGFSGAPGNTTPAPPTDPNAGLTGANRDAAVALENLFDSYGLSSLAPQIVKMIQNGYSSDTISIELQNTKEYQQRFAGNAARLKAGLPVLSPADYISTENSYRQIMASAGLPVGFYDSTDDFTKFIANDVSPTEVQDRVNAAAEAIQKAPAATTNYFKQWYNTGDLIAYALDPKVAAPLVEQRIKAAESAAIAAQNGTALTQAAGEDIGASGASLADIQSGLSFVSQEGQTDQKLDQMYGGNVTTSDLVSEVFDNNAAAAQKRQKLASQERGSFAGSSGPTSGSLAANSGGI
jgi:hypothetical protein